MKKLLPEYASSKSLDAMTYRYCSMHERLFNDTEVAHVVGGLSLIVRHWRFGHHAWAVNAALLLSKSEPLETLTMNDLAVYKMRIFRYVYDKHYDNALKLLDLVEGVWGQDYFTFATRENIAGWTKWRSITITKPARHVRASSQAGRYGI